MQSAVSDLHAAAAVLAAVDPTQLTPAALADLVVELRTVTDGLEGTWSRLVAALDGSGALEGGTTAFLRSACRLAPATARSRVVLARRLTERPTVADALVAGDISVDHARLLTRALDELADADPRLAVDTEAPLVAAARRTDPSRLRRELAHARHALTPDAAAAADETAHARRHLDVSTTFDGMVAVSGTLDPEGGEILLTALTALSSPAGPTDDRTPGQRRADALTDLCRRQLDRADLPVLAGERPHLTVLVPLTALTSPVGARPYRLGSRDGSRFPAPSAVPGSSGHRSTLVADTDPPDGWTTGPDGHVERGSDTGRPAAGGPSDAAPVRRRERRSDLVGSVSGETRWGAVLGAEAVRRLACDASVTRVVLGPESQPLDVGRRSRVIPPAIRTALVVRDRGCVHPGCDRGPQWTDAHHVRHWADGGPTSLDNLVLLCRRHHRTVHEGHSRLPGTAAPPVLLPPPGDPARDQPEHAA